MEQTIDKTWHLDLGQPSHLINSKKFLSNFHSELEQENKFMKDKVDLSGKLTEEQYNNISEICSIPQDNEMSNQFFIDPTIFSTDLQEISSGLSLASLKSDAKFKAPFKKRMDLNYITSTANSVGNNNNCNDNNCNDRILNKNQKTFEKEAAINEIIYSVAFYNQGKPSSRMQEYLVLGSQPLSMLRDVFYCVRDFYKSENNIGENLSASLNNEGRKNPSSYFFIEDVFYNDLRDTDAIDYSKNIIEWVKENNRYQEPGLALYHSARMEKTLFRDLSIKLNKPYLFLHQDDCQHAVVFRDMRLMKSYDDSNICAYPKAIFRGRIHRNKCRMCVQRPAVVVTINDFLAGETPSYFCETCYDLFHYDENNKLLYDNFQVII